jgi:glycerol-3-phosphate dehydrogenase
MPLTEENIVKYDVIVIGGGVIGAAVLDELARYKLKALLLEAEDDVATGASRANSGIVHAGYDCKPGTLKARFNREGAAMMEKLAYELDVPFLKCGSIVAAAADGLDALKELRERGLKNGIPTEIIDREQILKLEPNVSESVEYALYAKQAAVISPYKLTVALAERAVKRGAEIRLEAAAESIEKTDDGFMVKTPKGEFCADVVVNAAGGGAARINRLLGAEEHQVNYQRGDYFVLDTTERKKINLVIFPLPTKLGKGILAAPTADGNVILGPTAINVEEGDTAVTKEGIEQIKSQITKTYRMPDYRKVIRLYSGVRAISGEDFVIQKSALVNGFIYLIGICSPGLTAAPAIAKHVVNELISTYKPLVLKENTIVELERRVKAAHLDADKLNALVKSDPAFGRIVCRCEKVTEAEVLLAIRSAVPATTIDAVKRRVRAGMGRCQGGFCAPRILEILSRELKTPLNEVKKGGKDSFIAMSKIKEEL